MTRLVPRAISQGEITIDNIMILLTSLATTFPIVESKNQSISESHKNFSDCFISNINLTTLCLSSLLTAKH